MVWLIIFGSAMVFALIFTPRGKIILRSCREFDRTVTANCEENKLECKRRMKAVMEAMEKEDLPSVQEAYDFIMNHSESKDDTKYSSINSKNIPDDSLKELLFAAVEKDGKTFNLCLMN